MKTLLSFIFIFAMSIEPIFGQYVRYSEMMVMHKKSLPTKSEIKKDLHADTLFCKRFCTSDTSDMRNIKIARLDVNNFLKIIHPTHDTFFDQESPLFFVSYIRSFFVSLDISDTSIVMIYSELFNIEQKKKRSLVWVFKPRGGRTAYSTYNPAKWAPKLKQTEFTLENTKPFSVRMGVFARGVSETVPVPLHRTEEMRAGWLVLHIPPVEGIISIYNVKKNFARIIDFLPGQDQYILLSKKSPSVNLHKNKIFLSL